MTRRRKKARNVAKPPRSGPGACLRAWRDQHLFSLFSSAGRILRRPWATTLTVGVMAVALVLPLCLVMLIGNVERVSGDFRESREVSLFLGADVSLHAAEALAETLRADAQVAEVRVRSPEQGLAEFLEMGDFAEALAVLDANPLPAVLVVTPAAQVEPLSIAQRLRDLPEVELVQHDALWRARLSAWLDFGRRLAWVTIALLSAGVLLVVGNTVRLDIQVRVEEIQTVQLLGASDGFVRRPFLYLGAWYGLLAGLAALLLAGLVLVLLRTPVAMLTESYGSQFRLQGLDGGMMLGTVLGSIMLGWLGAWLAAGHHLRRGLYGSESPS